MGNGFYELCQVARKTLIGKKEKRMHQPLIPEYLIIKFDITQNDWHRTLFHGVLFLERREGNGYKYAK